MELVLPVVSDDVGSGGCGCRNSSRKQSTAEVEALREQLEQAQANAEAQRERFDTELRNMQWKMRASVRWLGYELAEGRACQAVRSPRVTPPCPDFGQQEEGGRPSQPYLGNDRCVV